MEDSFAQIRRQARRVRGGCNSGIGTFAGFVDGTIGGILGKFGFFTAKHPYLVIVCSIVVFLVAVSGVANYTEETRSERLWIPQGTEAFDDKDYFEENFEKPPRVEEIIFVGAGPLDGENILTKESLLNAMDVHEGIADFTITSGGQTWDLESLCTKRGSEDDPSSPCLINAILEAWDFNRTLLQEDPHILQTINTFFSDERNDFEFYLGGVEQSGSVIVSAESFRFVYFLELRGSQNDPASSVLKWEEELLDLYDQERTGSLKSYVNAQRSLGDGFSAAITGDVILVFAGYVLIIAYAILVMSRLNFVRSRIILAVGGVFSVGMAIGFSIGICSGLGLFYGPVNSFLYFLLLGIGVDDMFIIVDAMTEANRSYPHLPISGRVKHAMRHAGTSITITSLTDMMAFLIGATTDLPALSSFCLFAAVGILGDYIFQVTFFVALMVLDLRRNESSKMECFPLLTCKGNLCGTGAYQLLDDDSMEEYEEEDSHTRETDEEEGQSTSNSSSLTTTTTSSSSASFESPSQGNTSDAPFEVDSSSGVHGTHSERPLLGGDGANNDDGSSLPIAWWERLSRGLARAQSGRDSARSWSNDTLHRFKLSSMLWCIGERSSPPRQAPPGRKLSNYLVYRFYAWLLMQKLVKLAVVIAFALLFGLSLYGATQLEQDFSQRFFIPTDDPLQEFYDVYDEYYEELGVQVYTVTETFDYYQEQPALYAIIEDLRESRWVRDGAVDSWYSEFIDWVSANPNTSSTLTDEGWVRDRGTFYHLLGEFLNSSQGSQYGDDVVWAGNGSSSQQIITARMATLTPYLEKALDQVDAMNAYRRLADKQSVPTFAYAFTFIFWEQFAIIQREFIQNLILALGAAALVVIVFLVHPLTALCVMLCICMIIVDLFGLMYVWDVTLDGVSLICAVAAIGLCVDYCVHIAHTFMLVDAKSRDKRVQIALGSTGVSVLNGAFSTFLAVLVLFFSNSYVFITFFKLFFGIILFGALHGFILMPVLLSWFGGPPHPHARKYEDGESWWNDQHSNDNNSHRKDGNDDSGDAGGQSCVPDSVTSIIAQARRGARHNTLWQTIRADL